MLADQVLGLKPAMSCLVFAEALEEGQEQPGQSTKVQTLRYAALILRMESLPSICKTFCNTSVYFISVCIQSVCQNVALKLASFQIGYIRCWVMA